MKAWIIGGVVVLACVVVIAASQFLTIFVIQPIGAVPEGRTLVIWRMQEMNFLDSADTFCRRKLGYVNIMLRIPMKVTGDSADPSIVLVQLPYSETLYLWTTGGRSYS